MANRIIEAPVEQPVEQAQPSELQFIIAEEWQGECCAPPAAPPANEIEQADDADWNAGRCVA